MFNEHFYTSSYGLTKVLTVLQCSLKSPYTNSRIYSLRNIIPMASRFLHRSGLSYAPVCVLVYVPSLTDWSQPIRPMLSLSLNNYDRRRTSNVRVVFLLNLFLHAAKSPCSIDEVECLSNNVCNVVRARRKLAIFELQQYTDVETIFVKKLFVSSTTLTILLSKQSSIKLYFDHI